MRKDKTSAAGNTARLTLSPSLPSEGNDDDPLELLAVDQLGLTSYLRARANRRLSSRFCPACGVPLTIYNLGFLRPLGDGMIVGCESPMCHLRLRDWAGPPSGTEVDRSLLGGARSDRALAMAAAASPGPLGLYGLDTLSSKAIDLSPYLGAGALGVVGAVAIMAVAQPAKAEWVAALIAKAGRGGYRIAAQHQMARHVTRTLTSGAEAYGNAAPEGVLGARPVKIKWVGPDDEEYWDDKDGKTILVMRWKERRGKNVANAMLSYLEGSLIPDARDSVDATTMKAVDHTVAAEILRGEQARIAVRELNERKDRLADEDPELKQEIVHTDQIAGAGLLTRLQLPEYLRIGRPLASWGTAEGYPPETSKFAKWVYQLATRKPGDDSVNLSFRGRFINVSVVLVGPKVNEPKHNTAPYHGAIARHRRRNADVVYLLARDGNIEGASCVYHEAKAEDYVRSATSETFALRTDFKERSKLDRTHAFVGRLWMERRSDRGFADQHYSATARRWEDVRPVSTVAGWQGRSGRGFGPA
jgi:hypothetical protein